MNSPRRVLSASALVAAIVLAACGDGSDGGATDTDAAPVTPSPPVETEPAPVDTESAPVESEPSPVETEPEPVETDPAPVDTESAPVETEPPPVESEPAPSGADGGCLVGDWVITNAEMNGYYDALETTLPGGGVAIDITRGEVRLSFTDTDYVYTGDFDLTLDAAGQTGTGVTTGTVNGTWEVVDGRIQTTLGESNLDVSVTVAGITLNGSDVANGLLDSVPIVNSPFDCAEPTIGFLVDEPTDARHDITLTPA